MNFPSRPTPESAAPSALSRWRVLLAGVAVMLCLLAVLGLAVERNFARLKEANRWNIHTYRVLERIDRIGTLLDLHEAQLRGFALTGNPRYLRQLKQSNGIGVRALVELRALTIDRALQQQRLSVIEPQFLAYKKRYVSPFMRDALSARETVTFRRLLSAQTGARDREIRQLQGRLHTMEASERELIELRARELTDAQHGTTRTLVVCSLFVVLLAIGLMFLLGRAIQGQQSATARMRALNQSLVEEVSERRVAEESLRASETGFRHLAEDSLDMICRHALDGTLTYVSPASRPLLGYDPAEMVGVHPARFRFDKIKSDNATSAVAFAAQLRDTHNKPLLRAYRHANGRKVWLEVVGHAIVDSHSGEVRAWHTAARDVSERVREEKERDRLLKGLRTVVEIADELIAAPTEESLLQRAVEMMHQRLGLKRCSIYLSAPLRDENESAAANESHYSSQMRGTFGTDENGRAVPEDELCYDTQSDPNPNDITPAPGERWIVRRDQLRYAWRAGRRVELPKRGWLARTPIATRGDVIGLFFHDGAPTDDPHDAVDQQLIVVFCSLLGALLERGRSQTRMNAQQRLLQSVMENAPLFLYSVDCDEKFTLATSNVLPLLGLDSNIMVGQRMSEVLPADSDSVRGMRRALKGETMQQELWFANRWLKMWRQPIYDENDEISGMIGIGLDITQQQQAQTALRESEARYRQVADSLHDVLFQTDARGYWTFLNAAWTEITGYAVESSLVTRCDKVLHFDDRAAFEDLLNQVKTSQSSGATSGHTLPESHQRLLRIVTRAGQKRWIEVTLRANFDADGVFVGTAGTLRDVTEKVAAEKELRETLEMKRAILQGASYAIISTDVHGIIQTFNPAAERLIGVSADEVVGKLTPTFFHDPVELRAGAEQYLQEFGRAPANGFEVLTMRGKRDGNSDSEWNCVRSDGTTFPMRISHSVLYGPQGAVAGHVAIGYDLTESQRAQTLKNEFVSVVSHELRTPLTSIRGALGLLSGGVAGELPARADQMIEIAEKNADRLVLLINDILDIEKIESGKMRFDKSEIPLAGLLESALESNRGYAQTLGVMLELEPLAPALQGATLTGDEGRLQQVMSNLISNACKWTPPGTAVKLRALVAPASAPASTLGETLGEAPENSRISIEVQDAGPGVPPEFEAHLFERFAQADGSATRGKGGTGLGLAVTLSIVEKHGGSIAYRAPDLAAGRVGATFHFELPAQHIATPPALLSALALPAEIPTLKRMLVIESDPAVAGVLRAILEDAGYGVEVAHSRAQALQIARAGEHFTGATLDLHLPDGDGLELIESLRSLPSMRSMPIAIVSSSCADDELSNKLCGERHAIEHWFCKPVVPAQLLGAIEGWLRADTDSANAKSQGKARVLHVEDDADICDVVALILGDLSRITTASTLAQARQRLRSEIFDLVLLDIGLPDGNGLELLEQIKQLQPPLPIVLFSAREAEAESASGVAAALIKSRTPNRELRAKIAELLENKDARIESAVTA